MADTSRLAFLDPETIELDPSQPRQVINEKALVEMEEDIKAKGMLQPISVLEYQPGRYRIIDGSRRLTVAKRLELQSIPAMIETQATSPLEIIGRQITANHQREDMDPLDLALALKMAKVLADIEKAETMLTEIEEALPSKDYLPLPSDSLPTRQRINLYDAYLSELKSKILASAAGLSKLYKQQIYLKDGGYVISYLATWEQVQRLCGVLKKNERVELVEIAELPPELIETVRQNSDPPTFRAKLNAIIEIPAEVRPALSFAVLERYGELEPKFVRLLARALKTLEMREVGELDFGRLFEIADTLAGKPDAVGAIVKEYQKFLPSITVGDVVTGIDNPLDNLQSQEEQTATEQLPEPVATNTAFSPNTQPSMRKVGKALPYPSQGEDDYHFNGDNTEFIPPGDGFDLLDGYPPQLRGKLENLDLSETVLLRMKKLTEDVRFKLAELLIENPDLEQKAIYSIISQLNKGVLFEEATETALASIIVKPLFVSVETELTGVITVDEEEQIKLIRLKILAGSEQLNEAYSLIKQLGKNNLFDLPTEIKAEVAETLSDTATILRKFGLL